jgi:hypothetical protein
LATLPEELVKKIENDIIVTGGSITNMCLKEEVKDFDIYLKTRDSTLLLATHYVNAFNKEKGNDVVAIDNDTDHDTVRIRLNAAGIATQGAIDPETPDDADVCEVLNEDTFDKAPYRPVFMSSNAITLSDKIQIITRFYGTPDEIHENFDFVHCTNYWTKESGTVLRQEALEAIMAKELRYVGSRYPLCSVIRTRKFITRGWTINAGQYLKMLFQTSLLDLTDIEVLKDQLVGVDSAYFMQLIEALTKKQENDPTFKLTPPYLAEIVDRVF